MKKKSRLHNLIIFLWLCLFTTSSAFSQSDKTVNARYLDNENHHSEYFSSLIKRALELTSESPQDYTLSPYKTPLPALRISYLAGKGKNINLFWAPAMPNFDVLNLIAIKQPLMKGLAGYRLLLINNDEQDTIAPMLTTNSLEQMRLAQVLGWVDNKIYKHNGFHIKAATSIDAMFTMLKAKRINAIPMGAHHIQQLIEQNKANNSKLAIETSTVIYYSLPYIFYLNEKEIKLAKRLEEGLQLMQGNGDFEGLFNHYHKETLELLDINKRHIIELDSSPFTTMDNKLKLH